MSWETIDRGLALRRWEGVKTVVFNVDTRLRKRQSLCLVRGTFAVLVATSSRPVKWLMVSKMRKQNYGFI